MKSNAFHSLPESAEIMRRLKQARGKFDCLSPDTCQVPGRVSNFPLALAGESADSGGCPFLGTSFGQAKEVQKQAFEKLV